MKYLFCLFAFAVLSCQQAGKTPEKKKYYISVSLGDSKKIDSLMLESDSLAFWEGVRTYTANRMVEGRLNGAGVDAANKARHFDVLDENGMSIIENISAENKEKAAQYINKQTNNSAF